MEITFNQTGDFEAVRAAEEWCAKQGISSGQMQRGEPRGLVRGNVRIAKWRNLTNKERASLDGTMTGDMRNGPVHISLKEKP